MSTCCGKQSGCCINQARKGHLLSQCLRRKTQKEPRGPTAGQGARFDVHSQSTLTENLPHCCVGSVFIMMLKNGCMLLARYILVYHDMILWMICVKPFSIMQQRYFGDMKNPIFASTLGSCMFLSNHFPSVLPFASMYDTHDPGVCLTLNCTKIHMYCKCRQTSLSPPPSMTKERCTMEDRSVLKNGEASTVSTRL